jgi:hypothetical protein
MVKRSTVKTLFLIMLSFTLSGTLFGQATFNWSGSGDGTDWTDASNWSYQSGSDANSNGYPDGGDHAVFAGGTAPSGNITGVPTSARVGDFTINGASYTITMGSEIRIDGNMSIVTGGLTMNGNRMIVYGNYSQTGGSVSMGTSTGHRFYGSFSQTGGSFNANSSRIQMRSSMTIGGTANFIDGFSTITFSDNSTPTLSINQDVDLYRVVLNNSGPSLTINGTSGTPTLTIADYFEVLSFDDLDSSTPLTLSGNASIDYAASAELIYNNSFVSAYEIGDEWPGAGVSNVVLRDNDLTIPDDSTKIITGTLTRESGTISLGSSSVLQYSSASLIYKDQSATIGDEWPSSNGPTDVVVNVSGGSVTASASKLVLGSLSLTAGTINLGSNDLTVLGNVVSDVNGNGTIADATTLVMGDRTTPANSTVDQTITGSLTLNKLYINKTGQGGGIVDNRVTVSGILSFTASGNITINNGDLKLTTDGRFSSSNLGTLTLVVNSGGLLQTGGQSLTTIGTISATSGRIEFDGSSTETLPTGITVGTIEIDNSSVAGVNVNSGTLTVSTSLILSNGVVTTSATNVLRLGASATIGGTPSSSNMIVGPLQLTFNDATDHLFPVGVTGKYRPATFSYDSFTGGSNEVLEMQYLETNPGGTAPNGVSTISSAGHYTLKKISGTSPTTVSYDLTLTYTDAGFNPEDRTRIIVQNGAGPIYSLPGSQSHNTGNDLVTATGITALPTNDFKLAFGSGVATLYWVSTTGNWSTGANWSSGSVPENGDAVVISNDGVNNPNTDALVVSFDNGVGTINLASLTVGDGAGTNRVELSLSGAASTLNLSGTTISVKSDGELTFIGTSIQNYEADSTTYAAGSIIDFRGGTVEADSYHDLEVRNGSGTLFSNGDITVAGDFVKSGINGTFSPGNNFTVTGTSTITSGTFSPTGNVTMHDDFTISGGTFTPSSNVSFKGTTFTMNGSSVLTNTQGTFTFNGSSAQNVANGNSAVTFYNLVINNSSHVTLNDPVSINGQLTLTSGNLITTAVNIPTLLAGATTSNGSQTSYIDGPVNLQTNSTTETDLPVGNNGKWRRIGIRPTSSAATTFRVAFHNESPFATFAPTAVPSGLNKVSTLFYWTVSRTSGTANADIKLFWEDVMDGVNASLTDVRVASINSGLNTWTDIGGSGTGSSQSGFVSYGAATSFTGFTLGSANGENSLPVELTSFAAENAVGGVTLSWTVESELNNEAFVLQRKADIDADYITVKEILGRGTDPIAMDYSYTDETVSDGASYAYRLISRDYSGALNYYTEGTVEILVEMIPEGYTLQQNYPNPFNPETTIRYTLSQSATISLVVFDINGRKVRTLLNQKNTSEGVFQQKWDGRNDAGQFVASGTYLYRLFVHNNRKIMTKKMILIK